MTKLIQVGGRLPSIELKKFGKPSLLLDNGLASLLIVARDYTGYVRRYLSNNDWKMLLFPRHLAPTIEQIYKDMIVSCCRDWDLFC